MRPHDFQPHPFVRDETTRLCVTCGRMAVGHDYFALLDAIDRLARERDEAREMLRGIRECIDLFQHDTMFDLKGHLLAILKGDTE